MFLPFLAKDPLLRYVRGRVSFSCKWKKINNSVNFYPQNRRINQFSSHKKGIRASVEKKRRIPFAVSADIDKFRFNSRKFAR
ncbi:hypothetical protein VK70_12775 [Paenibacillus durus ATCC 35681]|uniref:Uncharacterized protein n=1 Tax=Paenibacillus durus ATCC 35681 TaxID=1333534 RepID=A0A0F7F9V2_PAEDU|nr:hypothetical protein VK70_12775 [Paenibacillus durus ATCC 35681]